MSQCKYKPDKVIAAHILDEKLMENEEDIRNNILNNWSDEKTQVIIKLLLDLYTINTNFIIYYLRMILSLIYLKLMNKQFILLIN